MKPVTSIDDPRYVRAMSHPLRVRILAILQQRTATPHALAEVCGATLGTTAYHVRTLHGLGLIKLVKETRVRGAVQHHYRANARPTVSDEAWAKASPVAKQAEVGASLQIIDEFARASAAAGGFDRSDAALLRLTLRLDETGWKRLAEAYGRLFAEAQKIEEQAKERVAGDPHADGMVEAGAVMMLFEAAQVGMPDEPTTTRSRRKRRIESA